jgi:hypothetical protein
MTPRRRSGTLKLFELALALSPSHQGHSTGYSRTGRCCRPGYG